MKVRFKIVIVVLVVCIDVLCKTSSHSFENVKTFCLKRADVFQKGRHSRGAAIKLVLFYI